MDVLAQEALSATAAPTRAPAAKCCRSAACYHWRRDGELHIWNPDTVALLQQSVRTQNGEGLQTYREFAEVGQRRVGAQGVAARAA